MSAWRRAPKPQGERGHVLDGRDSIVRVVVAGVLTLSTILVNENVSLATGLAAIALMVAPSFWKATAVPR